MPATLPDCTSFSVAGYREVGSGAILKIALANREETLMILTTEALVGLLTNLNSALAIYDPLEEEMSEDFGAVLMREFLARKPQIVADDFGDWRPEEFRFDFDVRPEGTGIAVRVRRPDGGEDGFQMTGFVAGLLAVKLEELKKALAS